MEGTGGSIDLVVAKKRRASLGKKKKKEGNELRLKCYSDHHGDQERGEKDRDRVQSFPDSVPGHPERANQPKGKNPLFTEGEGKRGKLHSPMVPVEFKKEKEKKGNDSPTVGGGHHSPPLPM